jgi:hypothetical protein
MHDRNEYDYELSMAREWLGVDRKRISFWTYVFEGLKMTFISIIILAFIFLSGLVEGVI